MTEVDGLLPGLKGAGELTVTFDASDAHVVGVAIWTLTAGLDVKLQCVSGAQPNFCSYKELNTNHRSSPNCEDRHSGTF